MAGGWSCDGAVQDQIDDTVSDAVRGARARMPAGEGLEHCADCGEIIPARRREALPGIRTCVVCQGNAIKPSSTPASTGVAAKIANCGDDRGRRHS
jgi:phage/conjugal plasmid C-4 type zinc finger TraR family protein